MNQTPRSEPWTQITFHSSPQMKQPQTILIIQNIKKWTKYGFLFFLTLQRCPNQGPSQLNTLKKTINTYIHTYLLKYTLNCSAISLLSWPALQWQFNNTKKQMKLTDYSHIEDALINITLTSLDFSVAMTKYQHALSYDSWIINRAVLVSGHVACALVAMKGEDLQWGEKHTSPGTLYVCHTKPATSIRLTNTHNCPEEGNVVVINSPGSRRHLLFSWLVFSIHTTVAVVGKVWQVPINRWTLHQYWFWKSW